MSIHVEWLGTFALGTEAIPSGSVVPGGGLAVDPGNVALMIGADDLVVIEGPKDELLARLRRAIAQVEAIEHDSPIPADYLGEGDDWDE